MHNIEMAEVTEDFARCWKAAGLRIQNQAQGQLQSWLRSHLNPPFLEHLSFRLGNQLFYIQVEDVEGVLQTPGSQEGLASAMPAVLLRANSGVSAVLPMAAIQITPVCYLSLVLG
mgnify:CR=1 FL=1